MTSVSRRNFVKQSALGAAGATLLPGITARSAQNVSGANERVRVGLIGVGGKGGQHADIFSKLNNVDVVAICDADAGHADNVARKMSADGSRVAQYSDMRKLLEDDSIDAIVTATPNHWHALVTIWALQAGRHVYVEKPVCHNVFEGRMMIKAAEKYRKIVQAGFQNRSDVGLREFFPWLHAGNLGDIEMLYGQCFRSRQGIGDLRTTPLDPKVSNPQLDYNLWLGPADDIPITRNQLHYDWHWVWNTGNGDIGNQGPHELDLIQWARGDGALPKRVMTFGGRFAWNDAGETPNLQMAVFDFGDYPCYFEVRDLAMQPGSNSVTPNHQMHVGLYVKGEKGTFRGGRGGGKAYDHDGNTIQQFKGDGGGQHQQNFIDAIRAGDAAKVHARLDDAVKSSDLAHLANNAFRVGARANADEVKAALDGDDKARETLAFFESYLAAWNVDTNVDRYSLGTWLDVDPKKQRFTGGRNYKRAEKFMTRAYRNDFRITKNV